MLSNLTAVRPRAFLNQVENSAFNTSMTFITIWALFGEDIRPRALLADVLLLSASAFGADATVAMETV